MDFTTGMPPMPPEPEEGPPRRRVLYQPISQIKRRRRQYLWENRLPLGEMTLWVGHAGIGKSQGAVWLASAVSNGNLPGELLGTPASVLYLATEDSWEYTLAPRFDAAGGDSEMIYRIYAETEEGDEGTVSLAVDLAGLREAILATGARLVVLDALLSTFGGAKLTEQGVVRRHMEPLARLAQELNIAVVGVAHFRKANDANPLHMIAGSAEFGQVVRSAIGFAPDPEAEDGSCVLSVVKTNIAPRDTPSIRYRVEPGVVDTEEGPTDVGRFVVLGETDQNVADLLNAERGSVEDRSERAEAAEWLLAYLADNGGEAIAGDVIRDAEKAGFAKHTIQRARKKAGVKSQKSGLKGGWAWVLDPTTDSHTEGDRTPEDDTKNTKMTTHQPQSPSSPSLSSSPEPTPAASLSVVGEPAVHTTTSECRTPGCTTRVALDLYPHGHCHAHRAEGAA